MTLALVDDEPAKPPRDTPASELPSALRDLRINDADATLGAVLSECAAGRYDRPLWQHSVAQAGGDESGAVPLYLRARGTAIRLERRRSGEVQGERRPRRDPAPARGPDSRMRSDGGRSMQPSREAATRGQAATRQVLTRLQTWQLAAAAGALMLLVIGAVAWLLQGGDAAQPVVAQASARPKPTPAGTPALPAVPAPQAEPSLARRVAELEQANNWNVLVLYATEWTRKEPANAQAWTKLAQGYVRLGQLPEAAEAAAKAADLAPTSAAAWRESGEINRALERWPQARAAYERLLALDGNDPSALCAAALVARREGRVTDADPLAQRAAAAGKACTGETASGTIAASATVPVKPRRP
jgi:cytochrome c-type biogenesis protein CcmH/NrfG